MNAKFIRHPRFGSAAVIWCQARGRPEVVRIMLPQPGRSTACAMHRDYPDATLSSCLEIDHLARLILALLAGKAVRHSSNMLDLAALPPFQQAVLRATARIPRGQVRTYGQLAAQLGQPGAARAVGNALAANPFPLVIPCHRVIRTGGHLGGFGGGSTLKRALLALEGVAFDSTGHRQPA